LGPSTAEAQPTSAADAAARADAAGDDAADGGASASRIADASAADARSRTGPRSRFPKLILAPATQNFACSNYVNCFDDERGHCAREREDGSFDSSWTERTRAAPDGSPTACCYKTTRCKRPLETSEPY
jgi:hypothetical protein